MATGRSSGYRRLDKRHPFRRNQPARRFCMDRGASPRPDAPLENVGVGHLGISRRCGTVWRPPGRHYRGGVEAMENPASQPVSRDSISDATPFTPRGRPSIPTELRQSSHSVQSVLSRTRGQIRTSSTSRNIRPLFQSEILSTRQPTTVDETTCIRRDHGCAIRVLSAGCW